MGYPQTHLVDVLTPLNGGEWPPPNFETFASLVREAYDGGFEGPPKHGLKNIFCGSATQPRMRAEFKFAASILVNMPSKKVTVGDVQGALYDLAVYLWTLPGLCECVPGSTLPHNSTLYNSAASSSIIAPSTISHSAPASSNTVSELASLRSLCAEQAAAIASLRSLCAEQAAAIARHTAQIAVLQGQMMTLAEPAVRPPRVEAEPSFGVSSPCLSPMQQAQDVPLVIDTVLHPSSATVHLSHPPSFIIFSTPASLPLFRSSASV